MEEVCTNVAFFRLQKEKGSCIHPQYLQGGGQKHTLRPHHRGCSLVFSVAAFLSALDRLVWEGVFVGFDFTEQTLALPCLNSSQEVFFTSSTPTFAIQHPKRTG